MAAPTDGATVRGTVHLTLKGACRRTYPPAVESPTITVIIDRSISIWRPSDGDFITGTQAVQARVWVADGDKISSVDYLLDGTSIGGGGTTAPFHLSWNTDTATPGHHTLTAVLHYSNGGTAHQVSSDPLSI